jgi:hypothetical protein
MAWSLIQLVEEGVYITGEQAINLLKMHGNDTGNIQGKILLAEIEFVDPCGNIDKIVECVVEANAQNKFDSSKIMEWLGY